MTAPRPGLTAEQRRHVEHAREIYATAIETAEAGISSGGDAGLAYGTQLGAVRWNLGEMLRLVDQLTGGAP